MLSVEEENSGGDVAYVEVSRVNGSFINIDDVNGRHVTQVVGRFRELQQKDRRHMS